MISHGKIIFILLSLTASSITFKIGTQSSRDFHLQERGPGSRSTQHTPQVDDPGMEAVDLDHSAPEAAHVDDSGLEVAIPVDQQGRQFVQDAIAFHPTWEINKVTVSLLVPDTFEKTVIVDVPSSPYVAAMIGKDMRHVRDTWKRGFGPQYTSRIFDAFSESRDNHRSQALRQSGTKGFLKSKAYDLYSTLVSSVPENENTQYLETMRVAKSLAGERKVPIQVFFDDEHTGVPVNVADIPDKRRDLNREYINARSLETETIVKIVPLKDPAGPNNGGQPRPEQMVTLIDVLSPAMVHKRAASTLQEIDAQAISAPQNGVSTQFLDTIAAFQSVQANISNTILPILIDMTSKTNSSLIFQAAWSIWIDLTSPNQVAVGPFSHGLHCLDQLEEFQAQQMNVSTSDPAFQPYLAVSAILIDRYEDAWNRSYKAANQSGLLAQLYTLGSYLSISSNNTVAPPSFQQVRNNTYDDTFFTNYNRNNDLDSLLA